VTSERDIDLVDDLRRQPAECEWLEFKRNNADPQMIGKACSALANSARIAGRDCGYMVWGVADEGHAVLGTTFDPNTQRVRGQNLPIWLEQKLQPGIAFKFRRISHPDGDVVLLEVPAATSAPVRFEGTAYIRIGSATTSLQDKPERFQQLIERMRPYSWETDAAVTYAAGDDVLRLMDYAGYFDLTRQPLPDNRAGIFEKLEADRVIKRDVGERWNITNLGAILFAADLDAVGPELARKGVRFVQYDGPSRVAQVTHRQDGKRGYANGFAGLIRYINGLLPQNEHIGEAFREARPLFPELAIRELVANALIHQDMTVRGAGPQIELFPDRIEITNPGEPLIQPDRMIDLPPRSRNEALGALMRRIGLCEEQGSGLDKVIHEVELFQLPPPDFRAEQSGMRVVLYGPRTFAEMTVQERIRACYQHAVLKYVSGDKMRNASLRQRFGLEDRQASVASQIIKQACEAELIRPADPDHPRSAYVPFWA